MDSFGRDTRQVMHKHKNTHTQADEMQAYFHTISISSSFSSSTCRVHGAEDGALAIWDLLFGGWHDAEGTEQHDDAHACLMNTIHRSHCTVEVNLSARRSSHAAQCSHSVLLPESGFALSQVEYLVWTRWD